MQHGMPWKGAFYQRAFTSKENAFSDKDFNMEEENIFSLDKWKSRPHSCHYCCPLRQWNIRNYSNTVKGSFTEKRNRLNRFSSVEILNMHLMQHMENKNGLRTRSDLTSSYVLYLWNIAFFLYFITHTRAHSHICTCARTHTHWSPFAHFNSI